MCESTNIIHYFNLYACALLLVRHQSLLTVTQEHRLQVLPGFGTIYMPAHPAPAVGMATDGELR